MAYASDFRGFPNIYGTHQICQTVLSKTVFALYLLHIRDPATAHVYRETMSHCKCIYRMAGKFGREFNLADWWICECTDKLNSSNIYPWCHLVGGVWKRASEYEWTSKMALYKYFTKERLTYPFSFRQTSQKKLLQRMGLCCYHFPLLVLHPHTVSMCACKCDVFEHSLAQPPYLHYRHLNRTFVLGGAFVYVIAWFAVVFGINSTSNAEMIVRGKAGYIQFTALRVLLIPNTTTNHAITY